MRLTKTQLARVKSGKAKGVRLSIDWVDQDGQNPRISAKVNLVAP